MTPATLKAIAAKRARLQETIERNRATAEPLTPLEKEHGFKSWYASRNLPHFDSSGALQFITYRLADSLAQARSSDWEELLETHDEESQQRTIVRLLDQSHGECYRRNPEIADMFQENLWHHDGIKYRLHAWVIMPNHMHLLVEIWQVPTGKIIHSWKSYTSNQANKLLNRKGQFWERDFFDRYIRDDEHYNRAVRYIEQNPVKAGLVSDPRDWRWSSARFRSEALCSDRRLNLNHPTANRVSPERGRL